MPFSIRPSRRFYATPGGFFSDLNEVFISPKPVTPKPSGVPQTGQGGAVMGFFMLTYLFEKLVGQP